MPWVKLDDQLWSNPKVIAVGNEATGAYCRMLSYCGAHLTDGHVEDHIVKFIGKPSIAGQLVDHGFVEATETGLVIPDYLDFNPSKEKKEEERAAARRRKREAEERKAREREEAAQGNSR